MIKISIEEKLVLSILGLICLIQNNPNSNILKNDYKKYKLSVSQEVPDDALDVYSYLKMCYDNKSLTNTQYSEILNIFQMFRIDSVDPNIVAGKLRNVLSKLNTKIINPLETDLRMILKCFNTNAMDSSKIQQKLFNYATRKSMNVDFMKYSNLMSKE